MIEATLWRDYDDRVPDTWIGPAALEPHTVQALFDRGVRRVGLAEPVDLAADPVPALVLVRELTAYGIAVDWHLALGDVDWRLLAHLWPPSLVDKEIEQEWRGGYHFAKCTCRQGPGFRQVRDRRWGPLRRITIEDPAQHEAIDLLRFGAPADAVPMPLLSELIAARLVAIFGSVACWLPTGSDRWPRASRMV